MEPGKLKGFKAICSFTFLSVAFSIYIWLVPMMENDTPEELPLMKEELSVKRIAFWSTLWGKNAFAKSTIERRLKCDINVTCQLYDAKRYPLRYDALVFHGGDPHQPPLARSPHQAYIMLLQESPAWHDANYVAGGTFYNWTITYSRKSDFRSPYLTTKQHRLKADNHSISANGINNTVTDKSDSKTSGQTLTEKYNKLPGLEAAMHHSRQVGEAMVLWIVSHCNTIGRRELYVEALRKHLPIDIYGKCGTDCKPFETQSGLQCHDYLARTGRYKFYLSFENSACRDYITEKVLSALKYGHVPVVYGGLSTENYIDLLPPGSFIDVRNFSSPKHLSEYLKYLDRDDKAYLTYHAWRENWEVAVGNLWCPEWEVRISEHLWCDVCRALHNVSNVRPKNVDWAKFWDPATECDGHLLEKVLGSNISMTN